MAIRRMNPSEKADAYAGYLSAELSSNAPLRKLMDGQVGQTTDTFIPPTLTTAERDALTTGAPVIIFNSSTGKLNVWTGSAWEAVTSA